MCVLDHDTSGDNHGASDWTCRRGMGSASPGCMLDTVAGGRFPEGFLWGAATSAHQTEGCNENTDWWQAERLGTVRHESGRACDLWNRYAEDIQLLERLGLNAFRMSVEWARIEPEPGRFDQAALDHYRRMVELQRERGIEPIVTLHHFTNPLWVTQRGAWTNSEVVDRFAAYADRVGRTLGDLVQWWVTLNEPTVFAIFGYVTGGWPPHKRRDFLGYFRHVRHCARAHAAARAALKAQRSDAMVSLAMHLNPLDPVHRWDPTDHVAKWIYDWLWQGRFLDRVEPHLDWVGVNYYFRLMVRWDMFPWRFFEEPEMGPHDKTEFGTEIYPEGLYRVLKRVGKMGKPVIITENGIADANDDQRAAYIVEHLRCAHRALQEGVDLRGYLHWSLMDNFEWAEGYKMRFGLAEVDFEDPRLPRRLRPSALVYREIARSNALSGEASGVLRLAERRARQAA